MCSVRKWVSSDARSEGSDWSPFYLHVRRAYDVASCQGMAKRTRPSAVLGIINAVCRAETRVAAQVGALADGEQRAGGPAVHREICSVKTPVAFMTTLAWRSNPARSRSPERGRPYFSS